eukprot:1156156-Pelagomonas_calceolata.AAC.5
MSCISTASMCLSRYSGLKEKAISLDCQATATICLFHTACKASISSVQCMLASSDTSEEVREDISETFWRRVVEVSGNHSQARAEPGVGVSLLESLSCHSTYQSWTTP